MFQKILVPVDGSDTSIAAIHRAVTIARAFGSTVTVVSVIDPYPFTGVSSDMAYGQEQYLVAANNEAAAALDLARNAASGLGFEVEVLVVEGHAVHRGIVETAESVDADLIVIGSHGRRGLEKLVLGSVTQRVLGDAHMPVLVVRD
ncbi:universal stress protein [Xylophilus rhododendri]|uniref:Universal stress protein n=1 Tax=Xylophilus rhododendri TaxID=2697032 RepID=A0A857JEL7_9BURK|nr:universal stress protein [Xylophilus rhododendri]QHJ01239.1 universal stress protein [Xylophilus rhododendri]